MADQQSRPRHPRSTLLPEPTKPPATAGRIAQEIKADTTSIIALLTETETDGPNPADMIIQLLQQIMEGQKQAWLMLAELSSAIEGLQSNSRRPALNSHG